MSIGQLIYGVCFKVYVYFYKLLIIFLMIGIVFGILQVFENIY